VRLEPPEEAAYLLFWSLGLALDLPLNLESGFAPGFAPFFLPGFGRKSTFFF
jgi:hypothetical protein